MAVYGFNRLKVVFSKNFLIRDSEHSYFTTKAIALAFCLLSLSLSLTHTHTHTHTF
jgi:hypothetical protein